MIVQNPGELLLLSLDDDDANTVVEDKFLVAIVVVVVVQADVTERIPKMDRTAWESVIVLL